MRRAAATPGEGAGHVDGLARARWAGIACAASRTLGRLRPDRIGSRVSSGLRVPVVASEAKAVREQTGLSQGDFAKLMRASLKTLQNWEQRRRHPMGPAAALLEIVATAPAVALKSLHG